MGTMTPLEPSHDRLISRLGVMFFNDPPPSPDPGRARDAVRHARLAFDELPL